jgi:hypothetical protein
MGAGGGGVDGRGGSGGGVCAPDAAAWTTGSVSLPEGGGVDGEPAAKTKARWRRHKGREGFLAWLMANPIAHLFPCIAGAIGPAQ